jgi:hypothetical protein
MTPEERTRASLCYLRCCEMVSRAREDGDLPGIRLWEKRRDEWRLTLREGLNPERGPQGDAAL